MTESENSGIKGYLDILIDSLERKKEILELIRAENEKQAATLKKEEGLAIFDACVKEKEKLLEKLEKLDSGFDTVYARIHDRLLETKEEFPVEIRELQRLITEVTEIGVSITASEQRNKVLVENYFSYLKQQNTAAKRSVQVATQYYRSMSGAAYPADSQLDFKK
ncbi:MAG: hypothetical protein K5641_08590 [Lachnospiraceae bacterium]|nr:hypothetical protein [Lachnospiraceae bacterium]